MESPDNSDAALLEEKLFSLAEVAAKQGVHYMTVYRHVRTGKLAATKLNGEWQVRECDLIARTAPSQGKPGSADISARSAAFRNRLLASDEPGAWSILENCLAAGADPADLHHELILPFLHRIGTDWASGTLAVSSEHTASAVMQRLVARLGPLMRTKGRSRGSIVIGAVAGDAHSLPAAIVADLLRNGGYDVLDLGANTPARSFAETVALVDRCKAVGLSASRSLDASIREAIEAIRLADSTLKIVVGGCSIQGAEHAKSLGADGTESDSRLIAAAFDEVIDSQVSPAVAQQ
ncbi:MAG: hypothetical protein HKN03_02790 [Acidimicrobiales bacterium]|nr:hypothetical protein [Acidimicrobiales bacterium]